MPEGNRYCRFLHKVGVGTMGQRRHIIIYIASDTLPFRPCFSVYIGCSCLSYLAMQINKKFPSRARKKSSTILRWQLFTFGLP